MFDPTRTETAEDRSGRFDLDRIGTTRFYNVAPATDAELPEAVDFAARYYPHVRMMSDAIRRVHRRSGSILVVRGHRGIVGTVAFLCLNETGFARFRADKFPVDDPEVTWLTRSDESAEAIYAWILCTPGNAVAATGQFMQWLQQPQRARCDLYAYPESDAGKRFDTKVGFVPSGATLNGKPLWVYRRQSSRFQAA